MRLYTETRWQRTGIRVNKQKTFFVQEEVQIRQQSKMIVTEADHRNTSQACH